MTQDRRTILAIFSLAFGVRILYAALVGTNPDIVPNPNSFDFLIAGKIAAGSNWWSQPISPVAPGYQFLLAAFIRLAGANHWLIIIVQAIFGGIIAFLMYRIGERGLGRAVGLLSAVWYAVYIHHVHFTSLLVRDVTVTLFFVLLCYQMVLYSSRLSGILGTALVYAILVHIDPQFLLISPLVALYLFFFATRHKLINIQYTFLFLATVLALLVPWTVRNYMVYGEPIPVALETSRYIRPAGSMHVPGTDTNDTGQENEKRGPRSGLVKNTVELWRVTKLREDTGAENLPARPAWSARHNIISLINYGLLLPFFLAGIWLSVKHKNRAGLVLAAAIPGYYVIRAIHGGSERARLPIEPLLILLAFYTITGLYRRFRGIPGGQSEAGEAGEPDVRG